MLRITLFTVAIKIKTKVRHDTIRWLAY